MGITNIWLNIVIAIAPHSGSERKFGPGFGWGPWGSGLGQKNISSNLAEPGSNRTFFKYCMIYVALPLAGHLTEPEVRRRLRRSPLNWVRIAISTNSIRQSSARTLDTFTLHNQPCRYPRSERALCPFLPTVCSIAPFHRVFKVETD